MLLLDDKPDTVSTSLLHKKTVFLPLHIALCSALQLVLYITSTLNDVPSTSEREGQ